jgi:hypothetical protein
MPLSYLSMINRYYRVIDGCENWDRSEQADENGIEERQTTSIL